MSQEYVIEFRSGAYFQNLEADNGGDMQSAQRFGSKEKAEQFMDKYNWIYFNGGMAVPYLPPRVPLMVQIPTLLSRFMQRKLITS